MCQVIVRKFENQNISKVLDYLDIERYEDQLSIKGGNLDKNEGYSVFFQIKYKYSYIPNFVFLKKGNSISDIQKDSVELEKMVTDVEKIESIVFGLFSRQRPEMENHSDVNISPYYSNSFNSYFFVHGTISNDKKLTTKKLSVDTEIFENISIETLSNLEGLYSYIQIDSENNIKMIDKGMGKYVGNDINNIQTYSTTPVNELDCFKCPNPIANVQSRFPTTKPINVKIAFSGGMDVCLNTFKIISNLMENYQIFKIELVYFDYGARATKEEIEVGPKFIKFVGDYFAVMNDANITFSVLNIKNIIEGFVEVSGEKSKLLDKDAVGSIDETETTSAYVPYRNSLMCELLSAKAQKEIQTDKTFEKNLVYIGLGLNLSDGQVYGDNNMAWLEHMERTLSYGGKFYTETKILSPYINRTKINMLYEFSKEFSKDVLEKLLDISFSCYYPENGKSCGKCGSCLLREEAINEIESIKN